jgi:hypothetical protein
LAVTNSNNIEVYKCVCSKWYPPPTYLKDSHDHSGQFKGTVSGS